MQDATRAGWYVRGGAYVGASSLEDQVGVELDGPTLGAQLELARAFEFADGNIELGGRLSFGSRYVQGDDNMISGLDYEVATLDFFAEPVLRAYLPISADVRPYVEGFVGWGYSAAELTGNFGVLSASDSFSASGLTVGGGGGLEFGLTRTTVLDVGLQVRSTDYGTSEQDLGDIDATDIVGVVTFGSRW